MTKNPSFASQAMRLLAAASLACTVAAVGCSTDRTPGAGEPERFTPSVSPTMPSATPGTEQNRPLNPPMTSSYTAPSAVLPQHSNLDALAVAAANSAYRGRYLGPADPGGVASYPTNAQAAPMVTGQFINPSDTANPQITINRSISSPGYEAIGGDGGGGGAIFVDTTGAVVTTGATVAGTTAANTSAITTTPTTAATALSPTTAANTIAPTVTASNAAAPVLNTRGGLLNPTITSAAVPSPTAAANRGAGVVSSTTAGTTGTTTTSSTTSGLTTVGSATGSIVIVRNATGAVTITNRGGDGSVAPAATQATVPTLKFQ